LNVPQWNPRVLQIDHGQTMLLHGRHEAKKKYSATEVL